MSTVLSLVQGSTTTTLNDGSAILLINYTPRMADIDEPTITESADIVIKGANAAAIVASLDAIKARLTNAYKRNAEGNKALDRTYLSYQPENYPAAWRSEILKGSLVYEENIHSLPWSVKEIDLSITWERRNYWEGAEAQIPLTNGNGTNNTAGLVVLNASDGTGSPIRHNYVDIAAASIAGDLPAASRLEFTNTYGTLGARLGMIWIGHNYTNPATFGHILEGEASSIGTPTANANYSGGAWMSTDLPAGVETNLFKWTLNADYISRAAGKWFKFLAVFATSVGIQAGNLAQFRLKIQWNVTTLWESGLVTPDTDRALTIRDLCTFRLPPWLQGQPALGSLDLVLSGYFASGAAKTISLDFAQITPVDGWRLLDVIGYGMPENYRAVDDGIDGVLYADDGSGTGKVGLFVGYGNPIMLQPGKVQRLYFLTHGESLFTAPVIRSGSVKLFYRPRRRSL